ncbi:hypothetical protein BJ138DRAFT_977558, partial [Hygrophoropsis aurantiaca]
DYKVYERQLEDFMRLPHSRAALLTGGIVWRLAMFAILQDIDVLREVASGPSVDAVKHGRCVRDAGRLLFDDSLTTEELDFVVGTYYVDT